ncbi:MAG: diguanylate cyclase [Acidimicrobiales bacterium]
MVRGAPLVQRSGSWVPDRTEGDGGSAGDGAEVIDLAAAERAYRHLNVSVAVAAADEFGTSPDHPSDTARYAWVLLPADDEAAGATLRTNERRLRKILQNINDTVVIVDEEGRSIASSGQFSTEPVLGFAPEVWDQGLNMFDLIHPEDQGWVAQRLMELLDTPGERFGGRLRVRTADGGYVDAEGWAVNLLDDPDVRGILVTTRNVTDRLRDEAFLTGQAEVLRQIASSAPLELTMRRLAELVNRQIDGAVTVVLGGANGDEPRAFAAAAPGSAALPVGLTGEHAAAVTVEVAGLRHHAGSGPVVVHRDELAAQPGLVATLHSTGRDRAVILAIVDASGASATGHPVRLGSVLCLLEERRTPSPRDLEILGSAADLAAIAFEREQSEREMAHQALHDELTGLANRHLLLDRLEQAHNRAQRRGRRIALMFLDLDRFKNINDSLGHDVGDELLRQFAERLRLLVRPEDTVARFGGDEFVVLVEAVVDEGDITQIADRLELAMNEPFLLDGQQLTVTVSVGIVMASGDEEPATLLRNADTAMYRAKELGRNRTEIYDDTLEAHLADRTQLSLDLSSALAGGHLRLAYQPVVDLERGEVAVLEAQVRWDHPQHGRLLPLDFLAAAEDAGHGVELGAWIIERGLSDLAGFARDPAWVRVPGWSRPPKLAVQLSARQLAHPEMVPRLELALQRHRFLAANLAIDVPERVLTSAGEHVLRNLDALRRLGVTIAVDEVGATHSSALLSAMRRVQVDLLKIDASVVAGLRTVRGDASQAPQHSLAAGLIGLGHGLGLTVLAKGVDSALWLQQLRQLGCDLAQGAVVGAPVDGERLASLLSRSA